jgi:ABC-type transport system involved in multi-copper enzyme maturation permease subunit
MKTLRILYHLALADFYERTRRYGFLLTLAAAIFLGVLVNNGTLGMDLGSSDGNILIRYHGELNSAWIGTMTVMVTNLFLGLFGFYLVSDCIKRDIRTGVGQIIATTPVSRVTYLLGKWISNFSVLALLLLILAASAAVMVLLKREAALELGTLLMPFLAVALPYMALTAALAVAFETVPWLRGAVGNVIYFFVWMFSILGWMAAATMLPFFKDPLGNNIFGRSLYASASAAFPIEPISKLLSVGGYYMPGTQYRVFKWTGVDWTPGIVGAQWSWALLGLGLILLSALWFARFDPAREGLRRPRAKPEEAKSGEPAEPRKKAPRIALRFAPPSLSPLVSRLAQVSPFLGVLFAELRLLINGRRWWWWLGLAGLNIAMLSNPLSITKDYLLPIAWLWPLPVWSELGNREKSHNTYQMVFAAARPVLRQLPAAWLAGVLATALFGIAGALVFLSHGDLPALAGWLGAVVLIPSLALALGVFSSGSRVFEVVYLIWWYVGPFEKTAGIDFISGPPQAFLLAAAGLLLLSAFWRGRQVRA